MFMIYLIYEFMLYLISSRNQSTWLCCSLGISPLLDTPILSVCQAVTAGLASEWAGPGGPRRFMSIYNDIWFYDETQAVLDVLVLKRYGSH